MYFETKKNIHENNKKISSIGKLPKFTDSKQNYCTGLINI